MIVLIVSDAGRESQYKNSGGPKDVVAKSMSKVYDVEKEVPGTKGGFELKIVSLMDNVAASDQYLCSHGLSLYIETGKHKILFDMGPDEGFLENASRLGIDLSQVELAVLSHGHYDHGGGLTAFCQVNEKAKIHMHKKALGSFYAHDPDAVRYIGLPKERPWEERVVLHDRDEELLPGILLFSGVTGREYYSPGNDELYMEVAGRQVMDLFSHEQNLLVTEGAHSVLIAGCAHNGIVNILNKARTLTDQPITYAVGGMHLKGTPKLSAFAKKLAGRLKEEKCIFYTCHCTSVEGYHAMREAMGRQIHYLPAGSEIVI